MAENGRRTELDFKVLEDEVYKAMLTEGCKSMENAAKIRAVNQGVATYDQFRQIVKGARLKPVHKQTCEERHPFSASGRGDFCCSADNYCGCCCRIRKSTLGTNGYRHNPLETLKMISMYSEEMERQLDQGSPEDMDLEPHTLRGFRMKEEFRRMMRPMRNDPKGLFRALKMAGSADVGQTLLGREIPARFLGKIIEALLNFRQDCIQEICFVVRVLFRITKSERFIDVLELRSPPEEAVCTQLFNNLQSCLNGRQQDLAENGVTEWTLRELRKVYRV